jgi:hypothetical protein
MSDLIVFYDGANFALAVGSLNEGVFSQTGSWQMNKDSLGNFEASASIDGRTIFYNRYSGQTRIFQIGSGTPAPLHDYVIGGAISRFWTHLLPVGDLLFFYNAISGSAAIASMSSGSLATSASYPPAAFSAGWTHIASLGSTLLFYDTLRGAAAIGVADANGFSMLRSYEPGSLSSGWTHLVSSEDLLLFYNIVDGSGAVAEISNGALVTTHSLQAGQFTTGWTHLMGNRDGVLFYNAGDGSAVGGRIVTGGFETLKQYPPHSFSTNWTHILSRSSSRLRTPWQAIQGYAWPISGAPGDTITFFMSSGARPYETTCMSFRNFAGPLSASEIDANQDLVEIPVGPAVSRDPQYQFADLDPTEGCIRWQASFTFTIPHDWTSGIYAMKCTSGHEVHYVPFVVNPPNGRAAGLALVVNTNTWCAYNYWGGYGRYSEGWLGPAQLSVRRPHFALFGSNTYNTDQYNCRHLLRAELWFLNWLLESGYQADLWTDLDFHAGVDQLQEYAAVIVSSHPEYWSTQMMDRLESYLNSGGRLINLGANGLYDCVDIAEDFSTISVYGAYGPGRSHLFRQIGRPESAILGIAFPWLNDDSGNCAAWRVPYTPVNVDHPFMAGITVTDQIGATGWNYIIEESSPACAGGWEADVVDQWSPGQLEILATASVTTTQQLDMHLATYIHPGGGWVFSVGSMAFTGSIPSDPKVQQIIRNVLNAALA